MNPPRHDSLERPRPQLPLELVSYILEILWAEQLTTKERSSIYENSCLVNRTWLGLFLRVALRNVHIPHTMNASNYLRLLPERTAAELERADPYTTEASTLANKACRSITFDIDGRRTADGEGARAKDREGESAASTPSSVLYMVSALEHLPNLRHIALRYTDWGYDDAFAQLAGGAFPAQATRLSIEYVFTAPTLGAAGACMKVLYTRHHARPGDAGASGVRELAVAGAPAEFVADMLEACPRVETVEVVRPARLYVLAPLPPSVRTVVIRHPGAFLQREGMHWWALEMAVEDGLFTCGEGATVVVKSGTPEPGPFYRMARRLKEFGVRLVFERDEGSPETRTPTAELV